MKTASLRAQACFLGLAVTAVAAIMLVTDTFGGDRAPVVSKPTTGPSSQAKRECPLRLSEVKLDGADGSDNWWVELHNTSNQVYDAVGVTIVVNNKVVAGIASPDAGKNVAPTKVPARGLLLIQIDMKDQSSAAWTTTTRPKSRWVPTITAVPPGPDKPPPPQRTPGYCALFSSPALAQETLVDYVQWGRVRGNKRRSESHHGEWAAKQGFWPQDDAIPIGLHPAPGEWFPPPQGSSIARHLFASTRIGHEMWIVCSPKDNTPGAFNEVPPPVIHSPFGGHASDGPLGVSFMWRSIPPMIAYGADDTAKKPYHFQIAVDAVFEEIVFDSRYSDGAKSIPQGQLKLSTYWARVRYDSPRLSTGWSEARPFSYR